MECFTKLPLGETHFYSVLYVIIDNLKNWF